MSIESDVQTWQTNYSPLMALVTAVAQNAVPQAEDPPYVAWTILRTPDLGLANNVLAESIVSTHECWADSADVADEVADEVVAAMAAHGVVCTARATAYESELDLHATVLTFEWFD